MKKLLFVLVLGILGALMGAGCGGGTGDPAPSGPIVSIPKTANSLVFSVSMPQLRYARGTAIPFTFTVTNTDTQAADLTFGGCYDFSITITQGTKQFWWGPGALDFCGAVIRPGSIAAGATQTYTVTWDQKDLPNNADLTGTQVAAGDYTVTAQFAPATLNGAVINNIQLPTFATNPISLTIAP